MSEKELGVVGERANQVKHVVQCIADTFNQ